MARGTGLQDLVARFHPLSRGAVSSATRGALRRSPTDGETERGQSLLDCVIALSVLTIVFVPITYVLVHSLIAADQTKERSTAAAIIQQTDALIEHNVPTLTSVTAAEHYVAAAAEGYTVTNGTKTDPTVYTVSTASTPVAGSDLLTVSVKVTWTGAGLHRQQYLTDTLRVDYQ